jgi:HSP20 family protein
MPEITNNVPPKTEGTLAPPQARRRFEGVRREIGSLVEDFFGRRPSSTRRSFLDIASRRARAAFGSIPAVHVTETDKAYEITSELPGGMDEKNVEVKFAKGVLTIKGEKQEEREEKKKGYHMRERSLGSFERTFQVPESVDAEKIKTSFKKGVLAVACRRRLRHQRWKRRLPTKRVDPATIPKTRSGFPGRHDGEGP